MERAELRTGTVKLGRSVKSGVFAAIKKVKRLPQGHKVRLALSFTSLSRSSELME